MSVKVILQGQTKEGLKYDSNNLMQDGKNVIENIKDIIVPDESISYSKLAIDVKTIISDRGPLSSDIGTLGQKWLDTTHANLEATDYIAAKLAEKVATKEEYTDQLILRQLWRDEINKLEGNQ